MSVIVWASCTLLFLRGTTDEVYGRIASPEKHSLLLGTSRAAQGLYPAAFAQHADRFDGPMYNFAFTSATSPWGPAYFRAIQMKLGNPRPGKRGLFILEVSPLALSVKPSEGLRESKSFLSRLHSVTLNPNIEYPLYQAERGFDILEGLLQTAVGHPRKRLHDDGWLEITLKDRSSRFEQRFAAKLAQNRSSFEETSPSDVRWEHLQHSVEFLLTRGSVALVRLPMHPLMLELENEYRPHFDDEVRQVASRFDVPYIRLTDLSPEVTTTDGSHLAKDSAPVVTQALIDRLPREWLR